MRTVFVLLLLTGSAFAEETWLCTSEYIAIVTNVGSEVLGAHSEENDAAFVATESGVIYQGDGEQIFDHCTIEDLRLISCSNPGGSSTDSFRLDAAGVFTLYRSRTRGDTTNDMILKGKCIKQ